MKLFGILLAIVAVAVGGWYLFLKPTVVPDLTLAEPDGSPVTLSQLRGDRELLLVSVFIPKDPASKFTAELVNPLYQDKSGQVAFAGLVWGNRQQADQLAEEWQIPFPLYGVRDAPDPYAINELLEKVGTSHGTRAAINGGTILAIGPGNKLVFKLALEETRQLPEQLAAAGF